MIIPQQNINVRVGDRFSINLDENPSTGFTWSFAYVQQIFEPTGEEIRPKAGGRMPAQGGTRTFHFRATAPGTGLINFQQSRGNEISAKHTVEVRIQGNGAMPAPAPARPQMPAPKPQMPSMPQMPQMPGMPKIQMPQMPGMPPMPQMPNMPKIPGMQMGQLGNKRF
ncbi:hypothetical protein AMAG_12816 [Allomyces macrogynus ATCC 38327]|uniref:Proteinase inhibitor I42 chagasin domain-containing protein n=1 Tax=Allomyces macrogynus (strain ATCC 38327) TaxID=578462 RepID=A0A0L0T253_ALLM3|nr:hypothetical protein AMAG_12816 [Allomyces macrogynus ATCC 38327]|eukprot:KNE68649.1 hypothetical protein AMAG_12816 [Allomyces macrogynus ATCC 38327]